MKSRLKFIIPIVLLLLGGGYKFVLAKPHETKPSKIHGDVYVLGKDFLINLDDGAYAKLGVALVVKTGSAMPAKSGGHGSAAPKPPDGYGPLPQEAVARAVVTDVLTGADADDLRKAARRARLKSAIKRELAKTSDIPVHDVMFTDVAVQ